MIFAKKLPQNPIPEYARVFLDAKKPVFFGHYWLTGEQKILSESVACVDYSAGKGGPLVAYRWDGESLLRNAHFCSTD